MSLLSTLAILSLTLGIIGLLTLFIASARNVSQLSIKVNGLIKRFNQLETAPRGDSALVDYERLQRETERRLSQLRREADRQLSQLQIELAICSDANRKLLNSGACEKPTPKPDYYLSLDAFGKGQTK